MVLQDKGQSLRGIARQLGVAESTLRERLSREKSGASDERKDQASACDAYAAVITAWLARQRELAEAELPQEQIKALLGCLRVEHGFTGSYSSVWRYVQARIEPGKLRAIRRVETAPGTHRQVDWMTRPVFLESLGGEVKSGGIAGTGEGVSVPESVPPWMKIGLLSGVFVGCSSPSPSRRPTVQKNPVQSV